MKLFFLIVALLSLCSLVTAQGPKDTAIKIETISIIPAGHVDTGTGSCWIPTRRFENCIEIRCVIGRETPYTTIVEDETTCILKGLDFTKLPVGRNVNDIANTVPGILCIDGEILSIMGAQP